MLDSGRDDAMLRFGLGSAYFNDKDFARAVPHLQACIEWDKGYSAAYKLLGRALMRLDDREGALSAFENGLPVALARGDKQTAREITVFLRKLKP
jgi:Flp pilus assembly protein TadD